eukprot:2027132-Alexandrium_andersonii.AAC.1
MSCRSLASIGLTGAGPSGAQTKATLGVRGCRTLRAMMWTLLRATKPGCMPSVMLCGRPSG